MKNLQEYILNDMKSFKTSLGESLLDDLDDLEKESDHIVDDKFTLFANYITKYIMIYNLGDVSKNIDKKEIKKIVPKHDYMIPIYNQKGVIAKSPVTTYVGLLVRGIMDLRIYNKDEMKEIIEEFLKPYIKSPFNVSISFGVKINLITINFPGLFTEIQISLKKR